MSPLVAAMIGVSLVCWGMTIYKLRDLIQDPGNRPLRALCVALVAITVSLTVQPLAPTIDRAAGVLDLARVVSNCLSIICVTAAQAFLLYMTSTVGPVRRQVRRHIAAMAATLLAIVVLFLATPPAISLSDPRVVNGDYYSAPVTTPYVFVYLTYLGWSLGRITLLATRYARIARRRLLRFGLRLIVVGSLFGLAYVTAKLAAIIGTALTGDAQPVLDLVTAICFTTAILLVLTGSTIPSWGPRVGMDRLWSWAAALRDYYRLRPLWTAIHQVLPRIALLPAEHGIGGALAVARDASFRRARLTIEILDGYATLRPWMSGRVLALARRTAEQAGLSGDRLASTVEAAVLGAALAARQRDQSPAEDSDEVPALPRAAQGADERQTDDVSAVDQVSWLIQVARAYRSPLVSSILTRVADTAAEPECPASPRPSP